MKSGKIVKSGKRGEIVKSGKRGEIVKSGKIKEALLQTIKLIEFVV